MFDMSGIHVASCTGRVRARSLAVSGVGGLLARPACYRSFRGIIFATIGLGSGGCHARYASPRGCGHSMSMSTLVCALSAPDRTSSAVIKTRRWVYRSAGIPKGCPKGNSTPTTRGVISCDAVCGIIVTTHVAIPAASIRRASTGTFRQQSGQTGARMTPSVRWARNSSMIAGAVEFLQADKPASWYPITEMWAGAAPPTTPSAARSLRTSTGSDTL